MFYKIFKILFLAFAVFYIFFITNENLALAFSRISDRITDSAPNAQSDHIITLRNTSPIPPSGKIVITPEAGNFFIMGGFDYTDVDFGTSSDRDGAYNQRSLSNTADADNDGIAVIASTTNGNFTINLNSTYGINAGEYMQIVLGSSSVFQINGDKQIINPGSTGLFNVNIKSYGTGDVLIDNTSIPVFIIQPVTMSARYGKRRASGTPSGVLGYGTSQAIMSLLTNYNATCRFGTVGTTTYSDLPSQFSFTGGYYHSYLLTGLANGTHYTYYVRCRDAYGVDDDTDFIIDFSISGLEGATGDEGGIPGHGGGGAGGGGGGGAGPTRGSGTGELLPYPPIPGTPSLILQGLAYQNSLVRLLQDGKEVQNIKADNNAQFMFSVYDLKQGVYTFGVWSDDANLQKSLTQSFTFYLREGTKTEIYKIFLPPTIRTDKNSIAAGESFLVSGQSVPASQMEIWFYPKKDTPVLEKDIVKSKAVADSAGRWSLPLTSANDLKGIYYVKARAIIDLNTQSDFSKVIEIGIGVKPGQGSCPGADLNRDGKVNLFDFSILLYYWGTDNDCADQNQDGIVNLIDFSIMMYYWTG